jgi:hypothetical protein
MNVNCELSIANRRVIYSEVTLEWGGKEQRLRRFKQFQLKRRENLAASSC